MSRRVHDRVARQYRSDEGIIAAKTMAALGTLSGIWNAWPDPVRVVDLGVGDGDFLERLRMVCPVALDPAGVDVSPAMLAQARSRLPELRGVQASAAQASDHLPLAGFDLAVAHFILAYVPLDDLLREAARLLTPGGVLSFATSTNQIARPLDSILATMERSPNPWRRALATAVRRAEQRSGTPDTFDDMLPAITAAGFEVVARDSLDFPIEFTTPKEAYDFAIRDGWCVNILMQPFLPVTVADRLVRLGLHAFPYPYEAEHRVEVTLLRRL